jgi:hypothetical protein
MVLGPIAVAVAMRTLTRQASLAKEAARAQNGDHRFFAPVGYDRQLHPAFLNVKDSLSGVPLREDALSLAVLHNCAWQTDFGEKSLQIEGPIFSM